MRFKQLSAQVEEGDSQEFMKPSEIFTGRHFRVRLAGCGRTVDVLTGMRT